MRVILVGYPGSQFLVPASRYLAEKYLPGFTLEYLNWTGDKGGWSNFVLNHLAEIEDEFIVFALDDYLLARPIDMEAFNFAKELFEDRQVKCVKLCRNTPEEHFEYPVTTQYSIWRRKALMELLSRTKDPWHFETTGSNLFRSFGWTSLCPVRPALEYNTSSALSSRWSGVKFDGLTQEDIDYINNNLIK